MRLKVRKQTPNRPHKAFGVTVIALCFWSAAVAKESAQPKQTDASKQAAAKDPFLGYFEGPELAIVIEQADKGYVGQIRKDGKLFPMRGTLLEETFKGTYVLNGESVNFALIRKADSLTFGSGFQLVTLKPAFDPRRYAGTFRAHGVSMEFVFTGNRRYDGRIVNKTVSTRLKGDLIGEELKGTFLASGKSMSFSCTLDGDQLTVKTSLETLKLNRVGTSIGGGAPRIVGTEMELYAPKDVVDTTIVVGPLNRRTAMIVQRDGKTYAVIDGVEQSGDFQFSGVMFSPDSQHIALLARSDRNWHAIIDGKLNGPYQSVGRGRDFFSADGKRWALVALLDGKWHVIDTGQRGATFDEIRGVLFSKNGKRLSYIGRRGSHWHMVDDGKIGLPVEAIAYDRALYSADGKYMAHVMTKGAKFVVVRDGKPGVACDKVSWLVFSPDSKRLAYAAVRGDRSFVVIDGQEQTPFDSVNSITFSKDGNHIAYKAWQNGKPLIVADGKIVDHGYQAVDHPIYSDDGGRLAFVAKASGGMATVIDQGRAGPLFTRIRDLSFSPNGKRLTYLAQTKNNRWLYVVDGHPTQSFDAPPSALEFSPDYLHFAFIGKRDGEYFLAIDGFPSRPIPPPLRGTRPIFDGPDKLHMLYRRGERFIRLDVKLVK